MTTNGLEKEILNTFHYVDSKDNIKYCNIVTDLPTMYKKYYAFDKNRGNLLNPYYRKTLLYP